VEREITNKPKKEVHIYIINKSGSNKFSYIQPDGFDIDGLVSHQDFLRLTENQQINIRTCYEEINPSKPINLLIQDPKILQNIQDPIKQQKISDKYIQIGNFYFINDTDKLCKGIIEILYKLRNVLFHGEIVPDNDTNKVYEPAYHILYTLIQAL
jgi:hypothetical protein